MQIQIQLDMFNLDVVLGKSTVLILNLLWYLYICIYCFVSVEFMCE